MSSSMVKGLCISQRNDSVTIGKDFHAYHATNLVFLWNAEVLSAPVSAWNDVVGNDVATCVPIFINVSLTS